MTRLLMSLGTLLVASCGLIDPSVDDFKLGFPDRRFNIDTAQWNLTVTGTFPTVPCTGTVECAMAADMFCDGQCAATCEASSCQAHVDIGLFQPINLALDAPEYSEIDDAAVIDVTVDAVEFEVFTNTLNTPVPPLFVYMAPIDVTDSTDPRASLVGTVSSVQPGQTGVVTMTVDAAGEAVLATYMENFRTAFNIIVAGTVDISAGQPVPEGMLEGRVVVRAHADAI